MSTATRVPETHDLEGDDALNALRRTGWGRLAKDSFQRFRTADGFSHSRALAFQITFTLLPATIAVVGLATILHAAKFRDILRHTITRLAPGPAGDIVVAAFKQGARTVGGGARAALLFGVVATLISAATAMGQVERGANRIYGLEQDRPTLKKYGVGLLLACTTGLLMVLAFALIVAGGARPTSAIRSLAAPRAALPAAAGRPAARPEPRPGPGRPAAGRSEGVRIGALGACLVSPWPGPGSRPHP